MVTSALQNGYTDSQGFTWEPCMGSGVSDIEWVAGYLLSLSEMELISTIKEYFPKEHLTRLAKALGA